jgi:hypothetical protein
MFEREQHYALMNRRNATGNFRLTEEVRESLPRQHTRRALARLNDLFLRRWAMPTVAHTVGGSVLEVLLCARAENPNPLPFTSSSTACPYLALLNGSAGACQMPILSVRRPWLILEQSNTPGAS